jgi:single-strand DNA-binding protein
MNLVVLNGRLTNKPELKTAASGKEYCQFTLAVRRYFKKNNETKNSTDFVECVAYGNLAKYIASKFDKGQPMLVKEGTIYTKSQDILGKKINLMQVVVLSVEFNLSDKEKNVEPPIVFGGQSYQAESDDESRAEKELNKQVKPRVKFQRSKPLTVDDHDDHDGYDY